MVQVLGSGVGYSRARSPDHLGTLCRKYFPGLVELASGARERATTSDRYALAVDDTYRNP